MYYLAEAFPFVKRLRIPLSRDQIMLLMAAINLAFLGFDIYLAHDLDRTIKPFEWIPIIFAPVAAVLLLIAGLVAIRNRPLANSIATLVLFSCIVVGGLGSFFHLRYALLVDAPAGQQISTNVLIWAPPLLGPLTFILIAFLGISAAWVEDPVDSGTLTLLSNRKLSMPLPKTRAYFLMVALFILITVISSVLDHARTGFANPWLWLPTFAGVFAIAVTWAMGVFTHLERSDLVAYIFAMLLLVVVGLVGAWLHVNHNLTGQGAVIGERFLRGGPFLAPLLFANMGALGIIVLLDPKAELRG